MIRQALTLCVDRILPARADLAALHVHAVRPRCNPCATRTCSGIIDMTTASSLCRCIRPAVLHAMPCLPTQRGRSPTSPTDEISGAHTHVGCPSHVTTAPRACHREYMQSGRPDAWCPRRIEFTALNASTASTTSSARLHSSYLVWAWAIVYSRCPVATPLDPRHRPSPQLQPARTWTREAVHCGAYMCVLAWKAGGNISRRPTVRCDRWRDAAAAR